MKQRAHRGERQDCREHIEKSVRELGVGRRRLWNLAASLICTRAHKLYKKCYSLSSARLQDELGSHYAEIINPILPPIHDAVRGSHTFGRIFAWNRKRVLLEIRRAADIRGWHEVTSLIDLAFLKHHPALPLHSYIHSSGAPELPLFVILRLTRNMSRADRAAVMTIIRQSGESYRQDRWGGRRYTIGSGFQRISRVGRREALRGSGLVDLDMRRSFVTLLLWVLLRHGISRDTFPALVGFAESCSLTPDEKTDANAAMNGKRRPRTRLGQQISSEMAVVRELLGGLGINVAGRDWLHRLLAPLEDRVLQGILDGLRFLSLRPLSLIFDGLICEDPGREGLEFLEGHLEAVFPGLGMRLAVKERY